MRHRTDRPTLRATCCGWAMRAGGCFSHKTVTLTRTAPGFVRRHGARVVVKLHGHAQALRLAVEERTPARPAAAGATRCARRGQEERIPTAWARTASLRPEGETGRATATAAALDGPGGFLRCGFSLRHHHRTAHQMNEAQRGRQRLGRPADAARQARHRGLTQADFFAQLRRAAALCQRRAKQRADVNVLVHDFG